MLSFLVLIILIMIVQQIKYSSDSEARVARNAETIAMMDQAIESVMLQALEDLRADAEGGASESEGEASPDAAPAGLGGADSGGQDSGSSDSREDAWAEAQRTELNGIQLRVFIQDEDSKFNVLSLMNEDEEKADRAFEALVRVLEACRADTTAEIASSDARAMASAMREFMEQRDDQYVPRPNLTSFNDEYPDLGFPQSLRDFTAADPRLFPEELFVDYRDEEDQRIYSINSFLTVFSCLSTVGGDSGSSGGDGDAPAQEASAADGRVNVNTAAPAVLSSLVDSRDVSYDFWDDIIEYRNEPDEESEDLDPADIPLDEFGEEQVSKQYFQSFEGLAEIDSWDGLDDEIKQDLEGLLKVESSVFSIYVTARKLTGREEFDARSSPAEVELQEEQSAGLVRTIRSVVWRKTSDTGEAVIIPIIRWEVVNYVPHEVLDYPDEER